MASKMHQSISPIPVTGKKQQPTTLANGEQTPHSFPHREKQIEPEKNGSSPSPSELQNENGTELANRTDTTDRHYNSNNRRKAIEAPKIPRSARPNSASKDGNVELESDHRHGGDSPARGRFLGINTTRSRTRQKSPRPQIKSQLLNESTVGIDGARNRGPMRRTSQRREREREKNLRGEFCRRRKKIFFFHIFRRGRELDFISWIRLINVVGCDW